MEFLQGVKNVRNKNFDRFPPPDGYRKTVKASRIGVRRCRKV